MAHTHTDSSVQLDNNDTKEKYKVVTFSAFNFYSSSARSKLEEKYHPLLEISSAINRQSVSFQLSKNARVHGWLKYKEGFSADLVNSLLEEFKVKPGARVLDPFLGSGTTSLVSHAKGISSIGFDLLPTSKITIAAKQHVLKYDLSEVRRAHEALKNLKIPTAYTERVNSIPITEGAYLDSIDRTLAYLQQWVDDSSYDASIKNLLLLCLVNSLERLSYTNKDGQYLRWDYRSSKVVASNQKRSAAGKPLLKTRLDKGTLPDVIVIVAGELELMLDDIVHIQESSTNETDTSIEFIEGSALDELPKIESNSIDCVITSPPYCNRYDYTRTYALELAFLGLDNDAVKSLRQKLLSATVENKSKLASLKQYYDSLLRHEDYSKVVEVLNGCEALQETIEALKTRSENGDLNNNGVVRMVEGYFTELAFVYSELYRVCKPGAYVAFVNDNVRYGGEIIPVDYLSTAIAEAFGFNPIKILSLKQQKGNSSQQMKKYGRAPLRKSITIWRKPA